MHALGYISDAVKEFLLPILLFFDSFDYSAIFPEGADSTSTEGNIYKNDGNNSTITESRSVDGQHKEKSRYGQLRFRVAYKERRGTLRVTIVDAWDLPPMDDNGLADPYVEVSLRTKSSTVAQNKFRTSIKTTCLNPVFNETAEIPLESDDVETGELVIKVMDCDYDCQDELIGTIRLPLSYLGISAVYKEHTCLILHDTMGEEGLVTGESRLLGHQLSTNDVAVLQLKISEQASQIYNMQLLLKSSTEDLKQASKNAKERKSDQMDLELKNYNLGAEIQTIKNVISQNSNTDGQHEDNPFHQKDDDTMYNSSSSSFDSSNFYIEDDLLQQDSVFLKLENTFNEVSTKKDHFMCQEKLQKLRKTMERKDHEITQLKAYLDALEPSLEHSANGQIEVGLHFSHVSSRLSIKIISANK